MPEVLVHQASGLQGLADQASPQLIAVVSHGDARSEQPVLWQLCTALTALSYPVVVLDGTTPETAENPGFQQLLDYRFGYAPFDAPTPDCHVIPAALGLALLERPSDLRNVGHLFAPNATVILYAGSEALAQLLVGTGVTPLLCISATKNAILTAYLALKRLLRGALLEPLFLNMMDPVRTDQRGVPSGALPSSFSDSVRQFLGYEVTAITLHSSQNARQRGLQIRQLAMRLLETALPLQAGLRAPTPAAGWQTGFLGRN